jgi:RepB DNA-primase from phage plasmid
VSDLAIHWREALPLWLAMLAGSEPTDGLLEVRTKPAGGRMARVGFFDAHDRPPMIQALAGAALVGDVYVGAAPRRRAPAGRPQGGGTDAIERAHALWVDADTAAAAEALRSFTPAPAILIRTSERGLHGWWPLARPLTPGYAKQACRRLAYHLGADMAATDVARIMRPPIGWNWKADPRQPVVCERLEVTRPLAPAAIVGDLPDPPAPRPADRPHFESSSPSAVLAGLTRTVASAERGNRNNVLHWAACRLAEHPELATPAAVDELRHAALSVGLGEAEVDATIRSARTRARAAA